MVEIKGGLDNDFVTGPAPRQKVGVGVEREIAANFALRLDYDADFASLKLPVSGINSDIVTQTGKVGLAYKF